MIFIGFTSMAVALYGLYFYIYEYSSSASENKHQGLSLENYDLGWKYVDDESVSDFSFDETDETDELSRTDNDDETYRLSRTEKTYRLSRNDETYRLSRNDEIDRLSSTDEIDRLSSTDEIDNLSQDIDESSSDSESEDEEREHQMIRKNRKIKISKQDLIDWGVEKQINDICQRISQQLKEQCYKDLLENYLGNSNYKRNPTKTFRRFFRNRGHIQHLKIPEDLPLVALHKLHETPEYLDQLYQDRGRLHQQMVNELKNKFLNNKNC